MNDQSSGKSKVNKEIFCWLSWKWWKGGSNSSEPRGVRRRWKLSYRSRHNQYARQQLWLFYTLFSQRWKASQSSLYIHIGGNRQCSIETRQDKSSSVLGAEVCGWKPHHLKPTASPVTLCTKPTSLSFYLVLCKSACNVSCFQEKRSALPFKRKNICKALAMALGMTARAQLRKCIC